MALVAVLSSSVLLLIALCLVDVNGFLVENGAFRQHQRVQAQPQWLLSRSAKNPTQNSSERDTNRTPKAIVEGYISPSDLPDITNALQRSGFDTSLMRAAHANNNDNLPSSIYRYSFVKATGMLKLQPSSSNHDNDNIDVPRWIPIISDMEHVLVQNGWSFLDPDESEPLSAFDIDAANEEGLYRPKWGQSHEKQGIYGFSELGYSLQPYTKEQIEDRAANLKEDLTRRVLLEGATDPPKLKKTHNGHDFSGSVHQLADQGVFVCAMGGLPLFTTHDLSPTTATSGWLSFSRPVSDDHVELVPPASDSIDQRVEVVCARTKCHLGHYFGQGEGYCINASAMDFYTLKDGNDPVLRTAFQASLPSSFRSMEVLSRLPNNPVSPGIKLLHQMVNDMASTKTVLLGAGCFWHVEFALRRLPGVVSTRVGYAGGTIHRPVSYKDVCQGHTGHAEVVQVDIVPHILSPKILFDCFLAMHDPTKSRAHGKHAKGTGQYRSCIFVQDPEIMSWTQRALDDCKSQLGKELSTELKLVPHDAHDGITNKFDGWFWDAEERHQRHDEKRLLCDTSSPMSLSIKYEGLSTLHATEWLLVYGKRSHSVLGSAETTTSLA